MMLWVRLLWLRLLLSLGLVLLFRLSLSCLFLRYERQGLNQMGRLFEQNGFLQLVLIGWVTWVVWIMWDLWVLAWLQKSRLFIPGRLEVLDQRGVDGTSQPRVRLRARHPLAHNILIWKVK